MTHPEPFRNHNRRTQAYLLGQGNPRPSLLEKVGGRVCLSLMIPSIKSQGTHPVFTIM